MSDPRRKKQIRRAIEKAVQFTLGHQGKFRRNAIEQGGWRYLRLSNQVSDADLSITSWQLLFLRSAQNAEFSVPKQHIDQAVDYVKNCFDQRRRTFTYCIFRGRHTTRAMAGAGIVSLAVSGNHNDRRAEVAGQWILSQPFNRYNRSSGVYGDRFHYSAYYCSQAMFQLGGEYWARFFPSLLQTLAANQRRDGSWDRESSYDGGYGNAYSSALVILSLTPPYQILPIYQR